MSLRDDLNLPEALFREVTDAYRREPRGRYESSPAEVIAPRDVEEVSAIVRRCAALGVPIVPYGGGTGLVGGQIAMGAGAVVLSLERMSAIRAVYPQENVMVVEAGAVLNNVRAAAEAEGRLFPLSLASEGSARIGGLLATNAGGVNVLRYGNARALCLGLEVVLPSGEIWHGLTRLRKDNAGYALRDLMIGSEGTLGVITAASLVLHPEPASQGTAIFIVPSPAKALALLSLAREHMAEGLTAFELIHGQSFDFLAETLPEIRLPFATAPEWCVLVDVGLPRGIDAVEAIAALYGAAEAQGLASEGVIANSEAERRSLWSLREHIPEANRRIGSISSHDVSLPLSCVPEFISRGGPALEAIGEFRVNCFGHLGDGNLHYNVFPPKGRARTEFEAIRDRVKQTVHDLADALD
ncbi:MAG: FAD-binding oxidoreductase, partial [Pseudomonadota bacterium]